MDSSFTQTQSNPAEDEHLKEWVDMFFDTGRQTSSFSEAKGNEAQAENETAHIKRECVDYQAR